MAAPNTNPADRATDAALRQVLRATGPVAGCDAELAAAYAEGRLHGAERRQVESHLAECAGCRGVATELLQERAPQEPAAEPAPARAWWRWQWAVPALAGVLIVGSVVFYQREQVLRPAGAPGPARQVVHNDRALAPALEVREPAQDEPVQPPQQPAAADLRQRAKPAAAQPASPPAANEEFRAARAGQVAEAEQLKDGREATVSAPADEVARANKVANAVAPTAPQAAPAAPPAAVGGTIQAERDAAGARRQEAASLDKEKAVALFAGRADMAPAPLPEGAPTRALARDSERVWAVSDGGRIFRSTDGGRTWTRLASPTTADLVAVRWDPQARTLTVQDRNGREYRVEP
jgi:hypothetical protein